MNKPYGSNKLNPLFVYNPEKHSELTKIAESLPNIVVSSATAANAVMLGGGYFNPLTGYMNVADAISVADNMTTTSGLFWPTPVMNIAESVTSIGSAKRISLRDPNVPGNPVIAVQDVESIETISDEQLQHIAKKIYGTNDNNHPGVEAFTTQGNIVVAGPIQVLNFSYFEIDFPETFRTAVQIRDEIEEYGWEKIVAFQTRNPMHRAHEELCRMAQQATGADGILVHMLLGKLKPGDIPASVRDASIRQMVEVYFPPNTVMITGYGFDMLFAGPREAVLHALFRQNCGCTHFIIGRDHAGVGDYYGPFDAQTIFDKLPDGVMQIEIFRADHTAWSKKLNKVVMMRDVPDHSKEDFILLSGTAVREMLSSGKPLPPEFSRPEVAKILMDYYQKEITLG
ncbi:MAG TPA: sulfate adenylyltransferase [Nitrospinota bacterium]|nr:sulfate adenylyltransferase [Nitrospinota bacterium]|tara:strand:- start:16024 stop:17217 length:1194 start_codon:yes stop_codon:yes gene_type:complete